MKNTDMFKTLSLTEQEVFRIWTREHYKKLDLDKLEIYHPVVRSELIEIILETI